MKKSHLIILGVAVLGLFAVTSINTIPQKEEAVHASQSQLMNQYKRRQDLVPQLVNVVKGAAHFERGLLEDVIKARQQSMTVKGEDLGAYIKAQDQLGASLSRLLVTVERYPDVKAVASYQTLQSQLEGNENRIAVARRDLIEATRSFNVTLKTFPGILWNKMIFGRSEAVFFQGETGSETPPAVNFN